MDLSLEGLSCLVVSCLSVCLSVSLSVSLSVFLSVSLSVCPVLSVCVSCVSFFLSVYPSVLSCLSFCLSVRLSCVAVFLSVCLSVCLFFLRVCCPPASQKRLQDIRITAGTGQWIFRFPSSSASTRTIQFFALSSAYNTYQSVGSGADLGVDTFMHMP